MNRVFSFIIIFSCCGLIGLVASPNMQLTTIQDYTAGIDLYFNLGEYTIQPQVIDGHYYDQIIASGIYLPPDAGSPDFPSLTRSIAIPQGAQVIVEVTDYRTQQYENITPVPAPVIPRGDDDNPLVYHQNPEIYHSGNLYPMEIVMSSTPYEIRGVDVVTFSIVPFQWDPMTKQLTVYTEIHFNISFIGGNGHFGEDRLRSRMWDKIIENSILNFDQLPDIDYAQRVKMIDQESRDNAEFVIIVPDDPDFIAWADSIKEWRIEEGIITEVFTLTDIGGTSSTIIENWINNAYNTWTIPPEAVLLLSDYPSSGDAYGIYAPFYSGFVSDNIYADIDNNNLPDITMGRITAQTNSQLETMILKDLDYERNPPLNNNFYQQPLSACGFQTERWFQLCAEVISGFWEYSLGKNTTRVYAIYSGNPQPGDPWSTAANTYTVVNYWSNLGYIPTTIPSGISWDGTAADMVNAINGGTFMLQHRDHGNLDGWGEPDFNISHINQLSNSAPYLPFVFSTNCLTGKYNDATEVFTERFHRIDNAGAIGVNAASETSYSFANDIYVWGIYDYMWPDFDPNYGNDGFHDARPAWAMNYGKYYLHFSSWYSNTNIKYVTYHLFHHHGDPYMRLFTEYPQYQTVHHPQILIEGEGSFPVTASEGSMIALVVGEQVIGRIEGADTTVWVPITPQTSGTTVKVCVTKQNSYRYTDEIEVAPGGYAYVVYSHIENISGGNSNSQINPGETYNATLAVANWGLFNATGVSGWLYSTDPSITTGMDTVLYGTVNSYDTVVAGSSNQFTISPGVQDSTVIEVELYCVDDNDSQWISTFEIIVNAPDLWVNGIDGPANINPGDNFNLTPQISNSGTGTAYNVDLLCSVDDPYVTVADSTGQIDSIAVDSVAILTDALQLSVSSSCPDPYFVDLIFNMESDGGMSFSDTLTMNIGNIFSDDFESGDSLWTYQGPSSWHLTEHRNHSSSHSMYCGEEGTWQYAAPVVNSRIITDSVSITLGSELTFWQWYEIADNSDKVQIQYTTDGGNNWELLYPDEGYTGTWAYPPYDSIYTGDYKVWEQQHVQIDHDGQVQISWLFFSSPSGVAEGYYFDDVNIALNSGFVGLEEEQNGPPGVNTYQFRLSPAYPNPVRNRAIISYSVGAEGPVSLKVYDLTGREITTLINQVQGPGNYRVEWDGRDNHGSMVSSGTYFYRMVSGSFSDGKKLIVVR